MKNIRQEHEAEQAEARFFAFLEKMERDHDEWVKRNKRHDLVFFYLSAGALVFTLCSIGLAIAIKIVWP